jgi:hypothetical protein
MWDATFALLWTSKDPPAAPNDCRSDELDTHDTLACWRAEGQNCRLPIRTFVSAGRLIAIRHQYRFW